MTKDISIALRVVLIVSLLPHPPAAAQDRDDRQPRYPVIVTPGTPSIWSMEQAHYLLNRLRANNDTIQTKAPSPDDLDPNAIGGIRLDALQTTLNASAALNSVAGFQNQVAVQQFGQSNARYNDLLRQTDALRTKLYSDQLRLAELKGEQERLKEIQASAKTEDPAATARLAQLGGQITALDAQNTATSSQIDSLSKLTGTVPSLGNLQTVDAPATLPASPRILDDSVKKLLSKTAESFTPKVQASVALDSFLQMQYEIVAKQLTSLRDEVGPGHRILFLEMPTSINSSDRRVWTGNGGEDKLAQSWWRVKRVIRRYDTESSPCWAGSEPDDQLHFGDSDLGRPERSAPKNTDKRTSAAVPPPPTPDEDPNAVPRADKLMSADKTLQESAIQLRSVIQHVEQMLPAEVTENDRRQLFGARQRLEDALIELHKPGFPIALLQAGEDLQRSYDEISQKLDLVNGSSTAHDIDEIKTRIDQIEQQLRLQREDFRAEWDKMMASLALRSANPQPYELKAQIVSEAESRCVAEWAAGRKISARLENTRQTINHLIEQAAKAADPNQTKSKDADDKRKQEKDRLDAISTLLQQIENLERRRPADILPIYQADIYYNLGGPSHITHAFSSTVESVDNSDNSSLGAGDVRSVDLIPHQTFLNVNTSHASVRDIGLSWAWHTLFGFGLKVDYQQQRETYNQFIQQEAFASAFGKGRSEFGWTFGPLPGSRVINSGTRSTYAVLVVPDDTTAIDVEATGCAFHRTQYPLKDYPGNDHASRREYNCSSPVLTRIEVPDRTNDGGFWISSVEYKQADPGTRTSILLRGRYFSPQTTVLVNGRRLPAVLGVGKPPQRLDFESGAPDPPDDNAISGVFEYVNRNQLVLDLTIPEKYDSDKFPVITLVAPSRAIILNRLNLSINGKYGKLDGESLLNKKPDPPSKLTLNGWRVLSLDGGKVTAHLMGQKLKDDLDAKQVSLNGESCTVDPMSDSMIKVTCSFPKLPDWEFTAVSSDAKSPVVASLVVTDPRLLTLTSYSVLDGTKYGDDLHPSLVKFRLVGTGFTPRTALAEPDPRIVLSYVSSTELLCVVSNPAQRETISIIDNKPEEVKVSIVVNRGEDKASGDPPKETTVTTTERKVVKK